MTAVKFKEYSLWCVYTIKVDNVNLNFLAPIDITTIFGNLLDNAIEATEKLKGEKYICIKIGSYHKMIVVSLSLIHI